MINHIKLSTNDKNRGIVSKFEVNGTKYRIMKDIGKFKFWFQYVPSGGRVYITARCFKRLEDAKKYIYDMDCPS